MATKSGRAGRLVAGDHGSGINLAPVFAELLESWLLEHGYVTQAVQAERLGIKRSALASYLTCGTSPDLHTLSLILANMRVKPLDFALRHEDIADTISVPRPTKEQKLDQEWHELFTTADRAMIIEIGREARQRGLWPVFRDMLKMTLRTVQLIEKQLRRKSG